MEVLLVGIDVGCRRHRVAVGRPDGPLIDQIDLEHQPASFSSFFTRIEKQAAKLGLSVSVAMEGYGGWARPLDEMVLSKGWKPTQRQQSEAGTLQGDIPRAGKNRCHRCLQDCRADAAASVIASGQGDPEQGGSGSAGES